MAKISEGRFVIPGEILFDTKDDANLIPGKGAYVIKGKLRASVPGYVYLKDEKREDKVLRKVEVLANDEEDDRIIPEEGTIVTAWVTDVGPSYAQCQLLYMEDRVMEKEFDYVLPKSELRDALFYNEIEVIDCVQPGDVIIARILDYSFKQRAFVLTIKEDELGVVYAKGLKTRLRPLDFETVVDDRTGVKEKRKIAKVPIFVNNEFFGDAAPKDATENCESPERSEQRSSTDVKEEPIDSDADAE